MSFLLVVTDLKLPWFMVMERSQFKYGFCKVMGSLFHAYTYNSGKIDKSKELSIQKLCIRHNALSPIRDLSHQFTDPIIDMVLLESLFSPFESTANKRD